MTTRPYQLLIVNQIKQIFISLIIYICYLRFQTNYAAKAGTLQDQNEDPLDDDEGAGAEGLRVG